MSTKSRCKSSPQSFRKFCRISKKATKIVFKKLLPRFIKKYGTGHSLHMALIKRTDDFTSFNILSEVNLNWLVDWNYKLQSKRFKAKLGGGIIPYEHKSTVSQPADESKAIILGEFIYNTWRESYAWGRSQTPNEVFHRELRSINLYFDSFCMLDMRCGYTVMSDKKHLTKIICNVILHEIVHACESFSDFPNIMGDREKMVKRFKGYLSRKVNI